jgi:hypothetical protein
MSDAGQVNVDAARPPAVESSPAVEIEIQELRLRLAELLAGVGQDRQAQVEIDAALAWPQAAAGTRGGQPGVATGPDDTVARLYRLASSTAQGRPMPALVNWIRAAVLVPGLPTDGSWTGPADRRGRSRSPWRQLCCWMGPATNSLSVG